MGCGASSFKGAAASPTKRRNTKRTGAEIMFHKYDKDNSGFISKEEFRQLCFAMGYKLNDEEIAIDMQILGNKDGLIGYKEFAKWWKSERRFNRLQWSPDDLRKVELIKKRFEEYDKDQSGRIDEKEFQMMHRDIVKMGFTTKPMEAAMKELDRNGDRKIEYTEYLKFILGVA